MSWWQYLLLVNVYLVLFYGFYALMLRRETFFQLNRLYLVCASALSFFIPLMQAGWVQNLFITREIKYTVYGHPVLISQLAPVKAVPLNIGQILAMIYITGVIALFAKLMWQLIVLNKIINQDNQDTAYSFFKKIKLPDAIKDNNIVAIHEQVHARQWHSIDVFVIEFVMIVNWFNPVVYFYRCAIKHIHEFIADDQATKEAANKADYALLLLTQTFHVPSHNLVNSFFNHSLLKQRIIMLQKNKSQRIKLLKYGLSAPLFMLMLVLSSATVNKSNAVKVISLRAEEVALMPINGKVIHDVTNLPDENHPYTAKMTIDTTSIKPTAPRKQITLQLDTTPKNRQLIFTAVEKEPEFPGGQENFIQFLAANIKIPQDMIVNNVSGRVIATFVVEADGSLSNIKVLRSPAESASNEAIRVLELSPKWSPGIQNGQAVRVLYAVPIAFMAPEKVIEETPAPDTNKKHITQLQTPPPLYIVNGNEANINITQIDPNTIESITVLKNQSAIQRYGEKAKYGVIIIILKGYKAPTVDQLPAKTN
ncbi:energy transducer TonB [Mucilaginibacter sp.]